MRRVAPAAALAVVAALGLLIALLAAAPPGVTLRADTRPIEPTKLKTGERCFDLDVLPDDTRLVRLQVARGAVAPEQVRLEANGTKPIASGSGVRRSEPGNLAVEYRLAQATRGDHTPARACLAVPRGGATVMGASGRPTITLLGAPRSSWIAALPLLTERAAFGRGTRLGIATLPIALLLLVAGWFLAVREISGPGRSLEPVGRRSVVRVGVIGALFCTAFALTTPPFQAPDEMVHLQYAELLADQQSLPRTTERRGDLTSPQGEAALGGAAVGRVAFSPDRRPPWTEVEDRALDTRLKALPSGGTVDSFTNASSQPPAYYVVVAVAQEIGGGSILDRLLIGRLISALLFGLAAAGAVAFAREAVPRAGGLVVAGGVLLASLPMFGFVGGSINPDALLAAVSAWTLVLLAQILRRGPTVRRGLLLGALVGLGLITKLIFVGLLPAVAVTALVVVVRGVRQGQLVPALAAIGAALLPLALLAGPYLGWAMLGDRGLAFAPPGPPGPIFSKRETVVYAVELFIGQFGPIMDRIPGSGPWDIWIAGLTSRLGWLDYGFPADWIRVIGWFWGALAVLAIVGIARSARARRGVPVDALVYLAAAVGLALVIAQAGLNALLSGQPLFEQGRYLLPVAAIGVGGVALGLRQLPRPWARDWAAAAVVVIGLLNGTVAFLITVGRYFA